MCCGVRWITKLWSGVCSEGTVVKKMKNVTSLYKMERKWVQSARKMRPRISDAKLGNTVTRFAAPPRHCQRWHFGCHSPPPGRLHRESGHSFALLTRPGPCVTAFCFHSTKSTYGRHSSRALKMIKLTSRASFSPYPSQSDRASVTGGLRGWPSA